MSRSLAAVPRTTAEREMPRFAALSDLACTHEFPYCVGVADRAKDDAPRVARILVDRIEGVFHVQRYHRERRRPGLHRSAFRGLVDETRKQLAEQYLKDSTLVVSEIAYLLGFAEVSSFSRAFRRWTGRAPRSAPNA